MRTHYYTRDLVSTEQARGRIASLINREPVMVSVSRFPAGSGVSGPKVLVVAATFRGRLEESRRTPNVVSSEAYTNFPVQWLLVALRDNDALDGLSGASVDIKTDDRVTVTDENNTPLGAFTVSGVQTLRSHVEVTMYQR